MSKQEKQKEIIKKREEYHNLESYDDEVDIVEELLEEVEKVERELLDAFEDVLKQLYDVYREWSPYYWTNGVLDHERFYLLQLSLENKDIHTDLSDIIDKLMNDVKELQVNQLMSWLIMDYEMTKRETEKSVVGRVNNKLFYNSYKKDTRTTEEKVVKPWCKDGKSFLVRVRDNTENLDMRLRAVILKGIARGWTPQQMGEYFRRLTGIAAYKAQRLLRTETMAAYSRATKEAFLENGIEYVEIIGDAACGGICLDYVGEYVKLEEAEIGDLLPPYHPNCACSFCSFVSFNEN